MFVFLVEKIARKMLYLDSEAVIWSVYGECLSYVCDKTMKHWCAPFLVYSFCFNGLSEIKLRHHFLEMCIEEEKKKE